MILWFVDRFGLPGQYHRIWVRLLRDNYIPIQEVQVVSLHKVMAPKQLLVKHGTRKAPTWNPDLGPEITARIDAIIAKLKPRAVVLTAPESLACIGVAPEHATLHNLRGSVYWRSGVPHLVMLPMSAWHSLVSQKEIGAANYGFENQETFTAARSGHGEIHPTGGHHGSRGLAEPVAGTANDSGTVARTGNVGQGRQGLTAQSPAIQVGPDQRHRLGAFAHLVGHGQVPDSHGEREGDATADGLRDGDVSGSGDWGSGDSADAEERELAAGAIPDDPADDSGESGEAGSGDDDDSGVDNDDDGVSSSDVGSDGGEDPDSVTDPEDVEMDQFFYEPVLSPVGRFVLTADTQKLFRILRDGKHAAGPARPIEVEWRK